jgi:hypothetical protein
MRQGQNGRRSRGNRRNNNSPNRTVDSSGPDTKIRGTLSHVYEKYQALAREANIAGERIASESYLQHAEHYFRLMNQAATSGGPVGRQDQTGEGQSQQQAATAPSGNGAAEGTVSAGDSEGRSSGSEAGGAGAQGRRRRARGRRSGGGRTNTDAPAAGSAAAGPAEATTGKIEADQRSEAPVAGTSEKAEAPDEA